MSEFLQNYDPRGFLIDSGIAIFGVALLLATIHLIEPFSMDSGVEAQLALTIVTAIMALAIYRQVSKENEYLENFEPSIKIIQARNSGVTSEPSAKRQPIDFVLGVANNSQTLATIEDVEIPKFPEAEIRIRGYELDNGSKTNDPAKADYYGIVPVEPNSMIYAKFTVQEESIGLEGDKFAELQDNMELTAVIHGSFGSREVKIDMEDREIIQ